MGDLDFKEKGVVLAGETFTMRNVETMRLQRRLNARFNGILFGSASIIDDKGNFICLPGKEDLYLDTVESIVKMLCEGLQLPPEKAENVIDMASDEEISEAFNAALELWFPLLLKKWEEVIKKTALQMPEE